MLTVSSQFIHQNLGISVDSHSVCLSLMWVLHFSDKLAQSADSSRPDSDSLLVDFRSFFFFLPNWNWRDFLSRHICNLKKPYTDRNLPVKPPERSHTLLVQVFD